MFRSCIRGLLGPTYGLLPFSWCEEAALKVHWERHAKWKDPRNKNFGEVKRMVMIMKTTTIIMTTTTTTMMMMMGMGMMMMKKA